MFERYTETARRVIISSKHKASPVGSPEIDTEHLLLGLLSTDKALARRFLGSPWAADSVWRKIEQSGKIGEAIKGPCDLPLSMYASLRCLMQSRRLKTKPVIWARASSAKDAYGLVPVPAVLTQPCFTCYFI